MAVSKRLRYEVLRRDGHTCRYCGRASPEVTLTVDHVVPVALGGTDDPNNLAAACRDCNAGKSASSPDATLVDDVAEDALRWSQALQAAADRMSADINARNARRAEFRRAWDEWHLGAGENPIPLPDDWGESVDAFLKAGLPMAILVDCIPRAMRAPKVKSTNVFRYMCGIAWNRVGELHEATRNTLGQASEEPEAANPVSAAEMASEVWAYLPFAVNEKRIAAWAVEFREAHTEDEDAESWQRWPDEACAALQAIDYMMDEFSAADIARRLLHKLSEPAQAYWINQAESTFIQHGEEPDSTSVIRFAVTLAFDHYCRAAGDHHKENEL